MVINRISFDGWEVDAAAVQEAAAKGWLVLTYPGKSEDWWRLPETGLPREGRAVRRGCLRKRKAG
jgi:hypothetical protein